MTPHTSSLQRIMLAAAIALPLEFGAGFAMAAPDDGPPPHDMRGPQGAPGMPVPGMAGHSGPDACGPAMGPAHDGMRNGPPGGEHAPFGPPMGMDGAPPFLHGLDLNEAQQDKVFAILYAEMPYLRDQAKAAGKAREALHALASATTPYDDAKAAALTQAEAQAMANITLQHLRSEQKILAVLTPEQRKQLADEQPHHLPHP